MYGGTAQDNVALNQALAFTKLINNSLIKRRGYHFAEYAAGY